jgi:hypothetical protein
VYEEKGVEDTKQGGIIRGYPPRAPPQIHPGAVPHPGIGQGLPLVFLPVLLLTSRTTRLLPTTARSSQDPGPPPQYPPQRGYEAKVILLGSTRPSTRISLATLRNVYPPYQHPMLYGGPPPQQHGGPPHGPPPPRAKIRTCLSTGRYADLEGIRRPNAAAAERDDRKTARSSQNSSRKETG